MRIDAIPEIQGIRKHSDENADMIFIRLSGFKKDNKERKKIVRDVLELPYHGRILIVFHNSEGNITFGITKDEINFKRRFIPRIHRAYNIGDALDSAIRMGYCVPTVEGLACRSLSLKKLRGITIYNYKSLTPESYADRIKDLAPSGWDHLLIQSKHEGGADT